MKELELLNKVTDNLNHLTSIECSFNMNNHGGLDAGIELNINGVRKNYYAEVKSTIQGYQIPQLKELSEKYHNKFIVIADTISPKVKEQLRVYNIPYMESNGNIWLSTKGLYIWIDTAKKTEIKKQKINRAFSKSGLRVVFLFLLNKNYINATYREIAHNSGVSLGNINYVFNGLKEDNFILTIDNKLLKLENKKELLGKWGYEYKKRLQPTLLMGTFRFLKEEDRLNWKKIQLRGTKTQWGGEAAAEFVSDIVASKLSIYTDETYQEIIKNYRLIPDPNGDVTVYRKFWTANEVIDNIVPPVLIYADLINSENKRCIEAAEIIFKQLLHD